MKISVKLTANAGVIVKIGDKVVLSDALHKTYVPRFSSVPSSIIESVENGTMCGSADVFLISHYHEDHFDSDLVKKYLSIHKSFCIAPFEFTDLAYCPKNERGSLTENGIRINYYQTLHAGKYSSDRHFVYKISYNGFSAVFMNDSAIRENDFSFVTEDGRPDVIFATFPWITLNTGKNLLNRFEIGDIIIYHLPFLEDDIIGFNYAAERAFQKYSGKGNIHILNKPGQEIELFK